MEIVQRVISQYRTGRALKPENLGGCTFDTLKGSTARDEVLQQCGLNDPTDTQKTDEELLTLADKNIHIFPYSSVKECWFSLHAHASIGVVEALLKSFDQESDPDGKEILLSEAISTLDNALLLAARGAEKQKDTIQEVFRLLEPIVKALDGDEHNGGTDDRPTKRRRISEQVDEFISVESTKVLPTQLCPLPTITHPVAIHPLMDPGKFGIRTSQSREPLLIQSKQKLGWPALCKWQDVQYWMDRTCGGRRLIPVEIGQSYNDDDWRQEIMPFKQFLNQYILPSESTDGEVGYLAQHDLVSQMPLLSADMPVPAYCYGDLRFRPPSQCGYHEQQNGNHLQHSKTADEARLESTREIHQNIWFGGRTVSPLHHDPYHNIFCQVHGVKYIRLYGPDHTTRLYPRSKNEPAPHQSNYTFDVYSVIESSSKGKDGATTPPAEAQPTSEEEPSGKEPSTIDMSNNSGVDVYAMELSPHEDWDEKWPGISQVPYVECILHPGDQLYIPKGWWHYVRALSATGISASFWWEGACEAE